VVHSQAHSTGLARVSNTASAPAGVEKLVGLLGLFGTRTGKISPATRTIEYLAAGPKSGECVGVGIVPGALTKHLVIELKAELIQGPKNQIRGARDDARAVEVFDSDQPLALVMASV